MSVKNDLASAEIIENKIFIIREQKVMLDNDLAKLYGVLTKNLNKAVKRNIERFPEDFMFKLTKEEAENSRFQFGTLKTKQGTNIKYLPLVFTEQGVAMLSSVLNSPQAIQVNIQIMRTFTRLRKILLTHQDLQIKIEKLLHQQMTQAGHLAEHDKNIDAIFEAIRQLLRNDEVINKRLTYEKEKEKNKKRGFQPPVVKIT